MPYRRLPNTDNARFKALNQAYQKGKELPPFKLAFSQSTFQKVIFFLPAFEKTMLRQKEAFINQIKRNTEFHEQMKKARLYISHFIQVVNMAIQRGELPSSIREYYQLTQCGAKLPPLNTEDEVILWGNNLIEGETSRIRKGFSPITNPTIAVVKVRYDNFIEAYNNKKNLQITTNKAFKDLADMRPQADEIIRNVWNEVEESFKDLPDNLKREKATEYGLVYVYRKNEKPDQDLFNQQRLGIS